MADPRDVFIQKVVPGKSFADVGGLWMTVNEKVSVAAKAGASSLGMLDVSVPESEWWPKFRERMETLGVRGCKEQIVDIAEYRGERYDVVHCSGVLYHHPNPMMLLAGLRRATKQHMVLTSAVTQLKIENELGSYTVPASGATFVPALNPKERAILAKYWQQIGAGVHGITEVVSYRIEEDNSFDAGPWWWLPTPQCMNAMAEAAGFKLVEEAPSWGGNAHTSLFAAV
jgi:hypothetical protein